MAARLAFPSSVGYMRRMQAGSPGGKKDYIIPMTRVK